MKNHSKTIRVLLADDHTLFRAGIRALLEKRVGLNVVGEAGDGREVLKLCRSCPADVVLMDPGMPSLNGMEATARLTREFPQVRVIILSSQHSDEDVAQAWKAGARGYLLKQAAPDELHDAIQEVARGDLHFNEEISAGLLHRQGRRPAPGWRGALEQLTERQREVLQLMAEGQNTKAIALILRVSPKTVEYHRLQLMARLRIYDIAGLVRFALRTGLTRQEA
jgi:DNA-binding NarL/FixJ family response regulator